MLPQQAGGDSERYQTGDSGPPAQYSEVNIQVVANENIWTKATHGFWFAVSCAWVGLKSPSRSVKRACKVSNFATLLSSFETLA